MSEHSNSDLSREKIEHLNRSDLSKRDKLNYVGLSEEFWKDIKNTSSLSLIEGWWGAGKSSFANFMLRQIKNDINFLSTNGKKRLLPIFFSPWYISTQKDFYGSFFDTFSNSLLQQKYSKINKETGKLIEALREDGTWWLNLLSYIFPHSYDIEECIKSITEVIIKDYKDYQIVIVIDEIDRLSPIELLHVSKLLDILRRIHKCTDTISILCWDNKYLSQVYLPGSGKNINFLNYFSKFFDKKINLYDKSITYIAQYLAKKLFELNPFEEKEDSLKELLENLLFHLEGMNYNTSIRETDKVLSRISTIFEEVNNNRILQSDIKISELFDYKFMVYALYFSWINFNDPRKLSSLYRELSVVFDKYGIFARDSEQGESNIQKLKKLIEDNEIYLPILMIGNLKTSSPMDWEARQRRYYDVFLNIYKIFISEEFNILAIEKEVLYTKTAEIIKQNKSLDATELIRKHSKYFFEGKDRFFDGSNGFTEVRKKLRRDKNQKTILSIIKTITGDSSIVWNDSLERLISNINSLSLITADIILNHGDQSELGMEIIKNAFLDEPLCRYLFILYITYRANNKETLNEKLIEILSNHSSQSLSKLGNISIKNSELHTEYNYILSFINKYWKEKKIKKLEEVFKILLEKVNIFHNGIEDIDYGITIMLRQLLIILYQNNILDDTSIAGYLKDISAKYLSLMVTLYVRENTNSFEGKYLRESTGNETIFTYFKSNYNSKIKKYLKENINKLFVNRNIGGVVGLHRMYLDTEEEQNEYINFIQELFSN